MWTDTYCYEDECGSAPGPTPYGAALFPPTADDAFAPSVGGMIWPRGFVGAAAFWNYNASASPSAPGFVSAIWALNDQVTARGGYTCPSNCSCDQLAACGVPYLQPTPPPAGTPLTVAPCAAPFLGTAQGWALSADGTLASTANSSLCVQAAGEDVYPLVLGPCSGPGANAAAWKRTGTSEIVNEATGACLDLRTSDLAVGTFTCGSGQGLLQPNQEWAYDAASGVVVSLFNGQCLVATPPSSSASLMGAF
jgi:hypothetical protein